MATTRVAKTLAIHRQEGKNGIIVDKDPGEEASQSWKAGAPLVRDATSGELEMWAGGTDSSKIVGIAAADATGTTGADVPYYEMNDYNLFSATLINATAAYTLLGTELGLSYSLIASGNDWYVDVADTATDVVTVMQLIDPVGDINPRVVVRAFQSIQGNVL